MINEKGLKNIKFTAESCDYDSMDLNGDIDDIKAPVHFYHNYVKLTPFLKSLNSKNALKFIANLKHKMEMNWNFKVIAKYGSQKVNDENREIEDYINLFISFTNYVSDSDWFDFNSAINVDNVLSITMSNTMKAVKNNKHILNSVSDLDNVNDYRTNIKQNLRLYKIFRRGMRNYNRHGEVKFTGAMQKRLDKKFAPKKQHKLEPNMPF